MNIDIRIIRLLDKTAVIALGLAAAGIIAVIALSLMTRDLNKSNAALAEKISHIEALSGRAGKAANSVRSLEKKIKSSRSKGAVSSVSRIFEYLGLEARALKPLGSEKAGGYTEERAAVEADRMDLNAIVNLLYRIQSSPSPMIIRSISMSSDFEEPEKINLKITVAVLSG